MLECLGWPRLTPAWWWWYDGVTVPSVSDDQYAVVIPGGQFSTALKGPRNCPCMGPWPRGARWGWAPPPPMTNLSPPRLRCPFCRNYRPRYWGLSPPGILSVPLEFCQLLTIPGYGAAPVTADWPPFRTLTAAPAPRHIIVLDSFKGHRIGPYIWKKTSKRPIFNMLHIVRSSIIMENVTLRNKIIYPQVQCRPGPDEVLCETQSELIPC